MNNAICRASISLAALRNNLAIAKQCAPHSKVFAVVKADAYGHGIEHCLPAFEQSDAFAVARINEGIQARALSNKPILILSGCSGREALLACVEYQLTPVIHTLADWQLKQQIAPALPYWLKLDTGMHRLGLSYQELASIAQTRDTFCLGLLSHLSDAELLEKATTEKQLSQFQRFQSVWPDKAKSLANSAACLFHPAAHLDWVRPGIMLYGDNPSTQRTALSQQLQAAMSLNSQVIALREVNANDCVGYNGRWQAQDKALIATVAVGYADGYPRHAKDGTPVWINGQTYPLAGKVSMDLITVDVTGGTVRLGDTVELWGQHVSVSTVADYADTISYQLLSNISSRVAKTYL